jgi:hypothetical protein
VTPDGARRFCENPLPAFSPGADAPNTRLIDHPRALALVHLASAKRAALQNIPKDISDAARDDGDDRSHICEPTPDLRVELYRCMCLRRSRNRPGY